MKTPALIEVGQTLTVDELRRYGRHTALPEISVVGQERLKNAKVLCVGAGGLGSPILMYLAASGVGTIGIVEFDTVDVSNLQRQIIHGQSDIGASKAMSAEAKINEINPLINVVVHELRLDSTNVMEIFSQYDLIVDGTDNFATRYLINDACVLLSKPHIWGSVLRFDGQVSVFWSEYGPCYRCLHPQPATNQPSCAQAGVLGVLCASIAAIQVTEALKLLLGIGEPLIGSLMIYDALDMSYRSIVIHKDPLCVICSINPSQQGLMDDYDAFCGDKDSVSITVSTLKSKIDSGDSFALIDVREKWEFDIVKLPGAILIPVAAFKDGSALLQLPRDRPVILYCRSGVRSATCLDLVKAAGFTTATHVEGGVLAWAAQIDSTSPVY